MIIVIPRTICNLVQGGEGKWACINSGFLLQFGSKLEDFLYWKLNFSEHLSSLNARVESFFTKYRYIEGKSRQLWKLNEKSRKYKLGAPSTLRDLWVNEHFIPLLKGQISIWLVAVLFLIKKNFYSQRSPRYKGEWCKWRPDMRKLQGWG